MEVCVETLLLDRADARFRGELLARLGGLQVGQRLRLADALSGLPSRQGPGADALHPQPALTQFANCSIRAADVDEDTRTVALSFSSEQPYERWWGVEILGHAPGEVDMSWIASGRAPVLSDHDPRRQVGVVAKARIGNDRRGKASVRFSRGARADEEYQDVLDGVRVNVSVGYEIRELELVKQDGELKTYRVTDWRPIEVSLVSIPADTTVGVGRQAQQPKDARTKVQASASGVKIMETNDVISERERASSIMQLATRHNLRELGERAIAGGTSLELFRGLVLDHLHQQGSDRPGGRQLS